MGVLRIVMLRELVDRACAAIDSGEIRPSEADMMALAVVVAQEAGPLKHDLLCKLASRCPEGRAALTKMAQ